MAGGNFHGCSKEQVVAAQLGREASIPFEVAVVCPFGWPAVISNEPVTPEGAPNPNLYYLTCPYLIKELSRLEDGGFTERLQERLDRDRSLAEGMKVAQEGHRRQWTMALRGRKPAGGAGSPTIGGAGDDRRVKCLHAHFAYHLVYESYGVGVLIGDQLAELWCSDQRCRRLTSNGDG